MSILGVRCRHKEVLFPRARLLHSPIVPSNRMADEKMFAWKLWVFIFVVIVASLSQYQVMKQLERTAARKPCMRKAVSPSDFFFSKGIGVNQSYSLSAALKWKAWYTTARENKCCPVDHPLCIPEENPEFCCPVGYSKSSPGMLNGHAQLKRNTSRSVLIFRLKKIFNK